MNSLDRMNQQRTIIALSLIPGIGYFSVRRLKESLPMIEDVWRADEHFLHSVLKGRGKYSTEEIVKQLVEKSNELLSEADELLTRLKSVGTQFVLDVEEHFPRQLRRIPSPPYWLFVEGNPKSLTNNNCVAIVGSRKPEELSVRLAKKLTELLVSHNFTVVSGLAEGIDAAAHETTLALGGTTIAVLGHGVSQTFPKSTARLRDRISQRNGSVISEYFPNETYSRDHFLWRNRIQSGLSIAVVPIESGTSGGTARTVRFAIEQHKDVFGVMFSHASPTSNQVYELLNKLGKPIFQIPDETNSIIRFLRSTHPTDNS